MGREKRRLKVVARIVKTKFFFFVSSLSVCHVSCWLYHDDIMFSVLSLYLLLLLFRDSLDPMLLQELEYLKSHHVLNVVALDELSRRRYNVEGGSLSNLAAMVLARNATEPDARNQGLSGQPLTVYTSAEGHYSIPKNAGMIGIGRHNVCEVPTNDDGTMKVDALAEMIAKDRARGCTPMMINATAGTTVMGAFDPIDAIADVAEREGVWLHVDGAFGATLLLSPEHRDLMAGIERAHSVTWNAHKMMGVPLSCSVLLTRRLGQLTRQIGEGADYLFQSDCDDVNYGTRSIQCGRRNDVIKLWAAWRHHGDAGYASRIARQFELTSYAASIVRRADDMTLSCEPQSLTVCFEVDGCDSAAICDLLDRESLAMVGHGLVNGRRVIRIVCVNPEQTEADLDEFFANVRDVASRLPATEGQTPARLS